MIIASIIVHGSSIAVFTLGKRLNNMTITMTYTTNGNHSQGWLSRLPGTNSTRTSFSFHKQDISNTNILTTTEDNEPIGAVYPVTSKVAKPVGGMTRRRKNKQKQRLSTDEPHIPQNIPIDLNAERRAEREKFEQDERAAAAATALHVGEPLPVVIKDENGEKIQAVLPALKLKEVKRENVGGIQAYQEGSKMIIEDSDGEVIETVDTNVQPEDPNTLTRLPSLTKKSPDDFDSRPPQEHKKGPRNILEPVSGGRRVVAYRLDDDVIIENLEGEVIRRYRIANKPAAATADESTFVPAPLARSQSFLTASLNRTLSFVGLKKSNSTRASSSKGETSFVPVLTSSKAREHIDDDRLQKQLHKLFDNEKSGGSSNAKADSSFAGASGPSVVGSSGAEKTATMPATVQQTAAKLPSTGLNLRPASPVPRKSFIISSNDEYSNSESDSESDLDDDDDDEETEIEKQRRLAALKHQEEEDNREYLATRARALAEAEKAIEKTASKH